MKLKYYLLSILDITLFIIINSLANIFSLCALLSYLISLFATLILGSSTITSLWNNRIWKIKWIQKKFKCLPPNLNGEWNVKCTSSYNSEIVTNGKATITQTYKSIYISTTFDNSTGTSTTTTFLKNDTNIWELLYIYNNIAKVNKHKELGSHRGYSNLKVKIDSKGKITMEGYYSNYGRNSYGDIIFFR